MGIALLNSRSATGKEVASITINPFDASTGANGLLIVTVARHLGTSIDSVTFNGVAMTKLSAASVIGGGGNNELGYYYMVNPNAVGSIVVNFTGPIIAVVCVSYWSGVSQGNPFDVASSASGQSTTALATLNNVATGTTAVDGALYFTGTVPTVGAGQIQIVAAGINSVYGGQSFEGQVGSSIPMSWDSSQSGVWGIGAATLNPASSGGNFILVSGTSSGLSTLSGSSSRTYLIQGAFNGISSITAPLARNTPVIGSFSAQSAPQSVVNFVRSVGGGLNSLSTISAAVGLGKVFSGLFPATSLLQGVTRHTMLLAGTMQGISLTTAKPQMNLNPAGGVAGNSVLSAYFVRSRALSGAYTSTSSFTASSRASRVLSGSYVSTSSLGAGAILIGALAGSLSGASSLGAGMARAESLTGALSGTSAYSASIAISGQVVLSGAITAVSSLSASSSLDLPVGAMPFSEILTNGNFETGDFTGWSFWVNTNAGAAASNSVLSTLAYEGIYKARVDITNGGTADGHVQLLSNHRSITAGRNYVLRFAAKADAARTIRVTVEHTTTPFENYGLNSTINLKTSWQVFTLAFIANATVSNAQLSLRLGGDTTGVEFDSVSLYDEGSSVAYGTLSASPVLDMSVSALPFSEMLFNGDFEAPFSGDWTNWDNATGVSSLSRSSSLPYSGTSKAVVAITNGGGAYSNVKFAHRPAHLLSIVSGEEYTVRFAVRASYNRNILVRLIRDGSPYENFGFTTNVLPITTAWQTFAYTFTANTTTNQARLEFNLGNYDSSVVHIDYVSFYKAGASAGVTDLLVMPSLTLGPGGALTASSAVTALAGLDHSLFGTTSGMSAGSAGASLQRGLQGSLKGMSAASAVLTGSALAMLTGSASVMTSFSATPLLGRSIYAQTGVLSTLGGGAFTVYGALGVSPSALILAGGLKREISLWGALSGGANLLGVSSILAPPSATTLAASPRVVHMPGGGTAMLRTNVSRPAPQRFEGGRQGGGGRAFVKADSNAKTLADKNNNTRVTR